MSEATFDSTNPIVEFPVGKESFQVESNEAEESILKVEVEVLKRLLNRPNTVRLLHSGKREMYR
uniref:Uncharacterized protein n=1 Tax=Parascaris equorum TaxID=6256 RepID=A0A914RVR1_PAREQ